MTSVAPATSLFAIDGLLQVLLDVSLAGLHMFSPVYGPGAELEDFAIEYLNLAAQQMLGLRDFAAFAKRRDGATTIRTLLEFSWARAGDGVLEATVVADAFCRSMVRALVGAVIPVGEGRRPIEWPAQVLVAGRRHPGVVVMPAHGLSLEEVTYPVDAELEARHKESRVRRVATGD